MARVRGWTGPEFQFDQICRLCGGVGRNHSPGDIWDGTLLVEEPLSRWIRRSYVGVAQLKDAFRGEWVCQRCKRGRGSGRLSDLARDCIDTMNAWEAARLSQRNIPVQAKQLG